MKPSVVLVSRRLLLAWCLWCLVSWMIHWGLYAPLLVESPGLGGVSWVRDQDPFKWPVHGLLQSMWLGLGLVWPLWRLSEVSVAQPGRQTAGDFLGLILVAQVMIWSLRMMNQWTLDRTLLVAACLAVWAFMVALCIWWGLKPRARPVRTAAMGMIILIQMGGFLALGAGAGPEAAAWTPVRMFWTLVWTDGAADLAALGERLGVMAALGGAGWLILSFGGQGPSVGEEPLSG